MHLLVKNILNRNHYHILKHTFNARIWLHWQVRWLFWKYDIFFKKSTFIIKN